MAAGNEKYDDNYIQHLQTQQIESALAEALKHGKEGSARLVSAAVREHGWPADSSSRREQAQQGLMSTALRQLHNSSSNTDLLLRIVASLLVASAPLLQSLIEEDELATILTSLRVDNTDETRAQATLAALKFLEAAPERGQTLLTGYVVSRIQRQSQQGFVEAFSAAAALFPVLPSTGAALFLSDGFVSDLHRVCEQATNATLKRAGLELLSAACTDTNCRKAIVSECSSWLAALLEQSQDQEIKVLAALVVAKTQTSSDRSELLKTFKEAFEQGNTRPTAIEGLAYCSTDPTVKQGLTADGDFLKKLIQTTQGEATKAATSDPSLFGVLTILTNVTSYKPRQTAEQQKMAQLKAYADRTAVPSVSPLEADAKVDERCTAVVNAGIVALLIVSASKATPSLLAIVSVILSSVTSPQPTRGVIAQQGGFDLALKLSTLPPTNDTIVTITHQAALALARLLVKLDPHLLFANRQPESAIPPLRLLLKPPDEGGPQSLWSVLESLMALTNLASLGDSNDAIADAISAGCWDDIESQLLNQALAIRRAAVQCVCNLCSMSAVALGKYTADPQAGQRVRVLAAFIHEDEDRGVRLAASAALSCILAYGGVEDYWKAERALPKLLLLLERDDLDGQLRALAILQALLLSEEHSSAMIAMSRKKLLDGGAVAVLQQLALVPSLSQDVSRCLVALTST